MLKAIEGESNNSVVSIFKSEMLKTSEIFRGLCKLLFIKTVKRLSESWMPKFACLPSNFGRKLPHVAVIKCAMF